MAKYIQQEYLDGDSFYPLPKEFNENIESIIRKVIILGAYRNDWKIILREGQENQKIKEGIATLHEKIIVWFDLSEESFVVTGFFISHVSKADEIEMLLEDAVYCINSDLEMRKEKRTYPFKDKIHCDMEKDYLAKQAVYENNNLIFEMIKEHINHLITQRLIAFHEALEKKCSEQQQSINKQDLET